jgi:hypothetical protein
MGVRLLKATSGLRPRHQLTAPSRACLITSLGQRSWHSGERVRAAQLTRGAAVKARAPVGRSLHLWCASLLRGWHSAAGALPSRPMPPFSRLHSLRQLHPGAPAWLALARSAAYNRSIDTDVLSAGFAHLLAAGHLQRCIAGK